MSYTQRRAHAAGHAPPTQRWRASFGGAGLTLVFGSRAVQITDLTALDETCRAADEAAQQKERTEAALQVHLEATASGAAQPLAHTLRKYKGAATCGGEVPQQALEEQHAWKLVGALFLPTGGPAGGDGASAFTQRDDGAAAAAQAERQREALRSWLQLALWDGTALACHRAVETTGDVGKQEQLWSLVGTLHPEAAVGAALADGASHAYLASLLAQPAAGVRADVRGLLRTLCPVVSTALGRWGGEDSALLPRRLAKLYALMSGHTPLPDEASADWMRKYALRLAADLDGCSLPAPEALPDERPPLDVFWHLLRLRVGGSEALRPLRTPPFESSSGNWQLRLPDVSFAWHLMEVVGPLLGTRTWSASIHDALVAQLQAGGWYALVGACLSSPRFDVGQLRTLLARSPLPDEPPSQLTALLEAVGAPAALTPAVEALKHAYLIAEAHATAAARAFRFPTVALRHWMAALRIAGRGDADTGLAVRSWRAALLLLDQLLPAHMTSAELRAIAHELRDSAAILDNSSIWPGSVSAAIVSGEPLGPLAAAAAARDEAMLGCLRTETLNLCAAAM